MLNSALLCNSHANEHIYLTGPISTPQVFLLQKFKVPLVSKEVRVSVDHFLDFVGTHIKQNKQTLFHLFKNNILKKKCREGFSIKYSSISVIRKNTMRKNNFLIHTKPHCECIYCYTQIHKIGLGIPLTQTPPLSNCLLVQTKLVSKLCMEEQF